MSKLALLGGEPAVRLDRKTARLPLVSERAIETVVGMMRRGEISTSPVVDEFTREFTDYIGAEFGVAVNNGTAALHCGLFAVGVGPGDEVLVPSYTFWASVGPIVALGAKPVFCDVDRETSNLDPADVLRKITPRTRAMMVVHVWGNPADMERLIAIARERGLGVVEDCSHAHGATWHGKKVGAVGDVGAFSLQGTKLVPGGEAGVVTTNVREYYERAALLGRCDQIAGFPPDSPYRKFARTGLFKYRPHPLGIAIARDHLRDLDARNEVRDTNAAALAARLADIPAILPQRVLPGCRRVYAYHYACYDERCLDGVSLEVFLKALRAEGAGVGRGGYGWLHERPLYVQGLSDGSDTASRQPVSLPVTEDLRKHVFSVAPRLETDCAELIDQYVDAYHKVAAAVDELRAYERDHPEASVAPVTAGTSENLL
jgi:dTDP-4-amino-4,6-dideoxygalactose transaminase